MTSPFAAILAGLGGGLSSAGNSMDERERLAAQNKRQSAIDAIARAQKLNEMDLEPADPNASPFANPAALAPASIPLQSGMSGGTNPVAPTQPTTASDLALRKLIALPNAAGGVDQYQEKAFADTKEGKAEARDAAKQKDQFDREQKLKQMNAIDPAVMQKALDGDTRAIAEVLSKQPSLQTTFNKPPAVKTPLTDYTTKDGKPVVQTANGFADMAGNPLGPNDVKRYEAPASNTYITGTDANGNPSIFAGATKGTPTLTDTGVGKPATGNTMSGSAQAQQARMMAAVSEARLADARMRTYEDGLLSGKTKISPLQQMGGTLMTNLSGSHSLSGAGTQAASEGLLNANSPDYAQYLRDAATIGRAEQMMSPRGGNETMVRANALLSRAGTGAMANTIEASRQARQALFGASGGIEQTLTPVQSQKLKAGVTAIRSGSTGTAETKVMSPAAYQSAKAHGYTDKEIIEQGYAIPKPDDE